MSDWDGYLNEVEAQVRVQGFMTHAMRRKLNTLQILADEEEVGQRIEELVSLYHRPYAGLPQLPAE